MVDNNKAGRSRAARHLFIGIPSYNWQVQIGTMRSLMADCVSLVERGDRFTIYDEAGNTEISLARESIVKAFLESDADKLLFVDDDVTWQRGALLRLFDNNLSLCAGVYPKRKDPVEWPIGWLPKKELQAIDGWLEVASVATGFLCLSRECLERMNEAFGAAMFDNIRDEKGRYSEDISFCARWRSIGGKVWIDPELKLGHVGFKHFHGSIGDWLRKRNGIS